MDGRLDGRVDRWHANGTKKIESHCVYGSMNGSWLAWHGNGQIACQGTYSHGVQEGAWTYFDESGQANEEKSGHYANGSKTR